jgi:uncharacterized membrane protein
VAGSDRRGNHEPAPRCALCERELRRPERVRVEAIRLADAERIAHAHPDRLPGSGVVCRTCLQRERLAHVMDQLQSERGQLSDIEADVARRANEHLAIADNLAKRFTAETTFGQRIADKVAEVGGSWAFVIGFLVTLGLWIALNVALATRAFDPYPYILLNLVLSCIAALQAPVIMMAQNRQAARDRMQAEQDFRVNLKAELEIASLHEKVDHLLHAQWERMVELQEMQLELLNELREPRGRG